MKYESTKQKTCSRATLTTAKTRRQRLNNTRAIHKPGPEDPIRIRKHAVLETDDDELAAAEARADQAADVLRVRQVEGGVDFVQDVHGCGGVLQEGEDEGKGD